MNEPLTIPDYFVAQFPGGGQRGYATVLILEWLEKTTGLPTHQLFPYVTSGSVGILIAAALYLPHPTEPNAARMSAAQLVKIFPDIAARTPQKVAMVRNKNNRDPFEEVLRLFIGQGKIKDLLGTVFFSSHKIGELSKSYQTPGKIIDPITGVARYTTDPETKIMEFALAGTALPSVFQSYDGHIDLAFAETASEALITIRRLFPNNANGSFVRVGNFRAIEGKSRVHLHDSGYIRQAFSAAILDAISDHSYAQTISFANKLFNGRIFNLEQEIPKDYQNPPAIQANITTPEQFERIRIMTDAYLHDHSEMLQFLASALKTNAYERLRKYPATGFSIPPIIQEFPLPKIAPLPDTRKVGEVMAPFNTAAKKVTDYAIGLSQAALLWAFNVATSKPVKDFIAETMLRLDRRMEKWGEKLIPPPIPRQQLPPPIENLEQREPL